MKNYTVLAKTKRGKIKRLGSFNDVHKMDTSRAKWRIKYPEVFVIAHNDLGEFPYVVRTFTDPKGYEKTKRIYDFTDVSCFF